MLCIAALFFLQNIAHAKQPSKILELDSYQGTAILSEYIDYFKDPTATLTIKDIVNDKGTDFLPLQTASLNFGFIEDRIWLRVKVSNKTNATGDWIIHTQENFLQYYDVYIQRASGGIEVLEQHRPHTRFTERTIAFPELVTAVKIPPSEEAILYIAYSSGGSSNISLFLLTLENYAARSMIQTSKTFISYGMMTILMVTALLAFIVLRLRVFFSYILYMTITLLFLMHSDGLAFQYFWPNYPVFNSYFSIIIGLAFSMVPYDFARVFLRTKIFHPRIDKFMVFMLIMTPVITIPLTFIDPQRTKQILMFLVFFAICSGTFAGFIAALKRFREVRFYVLAWVFGAGSAGLMNLRHFTHVDISQSVELDSIRIAIVVDAIMLGLGVADRYLQNLKASRALDKMNLQQAQQNLKLNERLFDLEEQYKLATELVETRDIQLKNTVHDLRQPLHALRLNVKKLQSNSTDQGDLDETFTYLETLIANHLQSSVREDMTVKTIHPKQENALNLPEILKSIYEMFLSDAESKGLDFRLVETTQKSNLPPLVIMRIITNIVSNAIKYTATGKIVLGVRRTHNSLRIEVHDTGAGLTQAQFDTAILRGTRLSISHNTSENKNSGSGLGLNIANTLARQNGLELLRLPGRQTGTSLALVIPSANVLKL